MVRKFCLFFLLSILGCEWDPHKRSNGDEDISTPTQKKPTSTNHADSGTVATESINTKPFIQKVPLSSYISPSGEVDLIRFHISADFGHIIIWKQIAFQIYNPAHLRFREFKLQRDDTDISSETITFTHAGTGADLATDITVDSVFTVISAFVYGKQELVSEFGVEYTLHAIISGASAGTYVQTTFVHSGTTLILPGILTNGEVVGDWVSSLNIYHVRVPTPSEQYFIRRGEFIWTDYPAYWLSDIPIEDIPSPQTIRF